MIINMKKMFGDNSGDDGGTCTSMSHPPFCFISFLAMEAVSYCMPDVVRCCKS